MRPMYRIAPLTIDQVTEVNNLPNTITFPIEVLGNVCKSFPCTLDPKYAAVLKIKGYQVDKMCLNTFIGYQIRKGDT